MYIPLNIWEVSLGEYASKKIIARDKWDIQWHVMRECCITTWLYTMEKIPCPTLSMQQMCGAWWEGGVQYCQLETTAFIYSDWLYFLWHVRKQPWENMHTDWLNILFNYNSIGTQNFSTSRWVNDGVKQLCYKCWRSCWCNNFGQWHWRPECICYTCMLAWNF